MPRPSAASEQASDDTSSKVKRGRVRKPSGPIKLEDVAKLANVSTATASRVINSPEKVSEETKQKVHAAIKALNWIPHGAAKALASLRTRTIGALIPTLGHQSISMMI